MDAVQIASVAGGIANTVVAIANICLVLFVYRQISMQREFFTFQSRREARIKISESWQKFASEMTSNPIAAQRFWSASRFWPSADVGQVNLIAPYMYTLNTLQFEFRFVEEGLHGYSNFLRTLKYVISTINNEAELSCVELLVKSVGFDEKFVDAVEKVIAERRHHI
jgi:hypothetical protein